MADALVLPGRMFGPGSPLPMYTGDVAARRGATVHRHEWTTTPPPIPGTDDQERMDWVRAQVVPVLDGLAGTPLLIGKSLGSYACGVAADRDLPAVWLTPLLTSPPVVAALERTRAPFLLVGGTGDESWDAGTARRLTRHVHEVPDADHGLYVPGPLTASITVLAGVVEAVDAFLGSLDWPAPLGTRPA
jgi:pimeloyl-ACP methyl ester carboxylesterase